jgi:trehalose 6-phosphate phosphatase
MKPLWREWPNLKQTIVAHQRLVLLLDFDGTLSPLAKTPAAARLPPRVRRLLLRLISLGGVRVAVISGRPVGYLRRTIRLRPVYYSGNHGLEIVGPRTSYCHPKAAGLRKQIHTWARSWQDSVARVPGAFLENKGVSLSLHYRRVLPCHLSAFRALVRRLQMETADYSIRWQRGKKVWEVLPAAAWDKGRAARMLTRRLKHFFPVIVGDDETDEDMFRAFQGKGLTITVGRIKSAAAWRIPRQSDVPRFLEALCDSWEHRRK